ncbi:hypothetical protein KK083_02165 [Fulvivirgaceae bacterium PWU4]|uniref:RNA polymerase sigma-70 region 2 domain-containing protein n=1 Tax=Chryseosolibacter histidini TaxID=2782349 RepID=A0AAP2GLB8_9BACT|nr:sigma factor [Chryseosolibacter histidini]MBT1695663.1 hypothetical protein [Chryseosolibacter histidini]
MYKTLSSFVLNLFLTFKNGFVNAQTTSQPVTRETLINTSDGINGVLVHAFAHGSRLAFRCIYDRYAPAIYRVSCRYFQSEQLAEALVSEVFSALWFKRAKFTEPEEIRLFLFTNARSVAMTYLENGKKKLSPSLITTVAKKISAFPGDFTISLRSFRVFP